jgi:hypothetical protein
MHSDTERRNVMSPQISFTKYENEVLPDFRKKLNLKMSSISSPKPLWNFATVLLRVK